MNLPKIVSTVQKTMSKHASEILTGIGIAGMLTSTVLAVRATPKAMMLIEELEENHKPIDVVKATWKCYIPATITGAVSIGCLIGANSVNVKRSAALATAYALSEASRIEYKDKVVEMIGEKKEKEVRDAIAKDKLERSPVEHKEIYIAKGGKTLCFDPFGSRYFESDMETLKRAENELNAMLLEDGSVCLNDLYYILELEPNNKIGDRLGWNAEARKDLVHFEFSSQLATDGRPCLVLDFAVEPKYDYYR